ncbi:hypothetical protein L914_03705 [Phytophthora nicotianae]|uniref:Uncharacterized protein n=1 Tax=Phytophthora nicotianae TaxID=4792 RepID=W2NYI8_PHYNI|nr:hypothetical protein L914_03705 [Phytophthora nicotianae]
MEISAVAGNTARQQSISASDVPTLRRHSWSS